MVYVIKKEKVLQLTGSEKGVLVIKNKSKKKPMKISDLKKITKIFEDKYKNDDNVKYYLRAFGNLAHPITFKSFEDEYINEDTLDDYLDGKVANKAKFDILYSVEIGYIKKL